MKRFLAVYMTLAMILSFMPAMAFADTSNSGYKLVFSEPCVILDQGESAEVEIYLVDSAGDLVTNAIIDVRFASNYSTSQRIPGTNTYTITNISGTNSDMDVSATLAPDDSEPVAYSVLSVFVPSRDLELQPREDHMLSSKGTLNLHINNADLDVFREFYPEIYKTFTYDLTLEKAVDFDANGEATAWGAFDNPTQCYTINGTSIIINGAAIWSQLVGNREQDILISACAFYKGKKIAQSYDKMSVHMFEAYDISKATVWKISSQTYNGKAKTPRPEVVYDGYGELEYGKDYTCSYKNNTNAGEATVTITGKGFFTGTKAVKFTINKAAITIKGKTVSLKASALKKKAQTISKTSAHSITKNDGKVTYKLASVSSSKYKKYFSVNSTSGKITVKKGLKKGTYKVKVKITAKGDKNHKAATKTVTVTVKVK